MLNRIQVALLVASPEDETNSHGFRYIMGKFGFCARSEGPTPYAPRRDRCLMLGAISLERSWRRRCSTGLPELHWRVSRPFRRLKGSVPMRSVVEGAESARSPRSRIPARAVCEWPWKRPVPASSSFESAGHNAAERHSRQDTVSDGRGLISASFEACEKGGSSRVNRTEPWPDLAAGASAPPTDSDHDGMPDAWKRRTASTLIILVTGPASPPTAIRTWRII